MKNSACYWKLEKFSLRYVHYAFVDTQPYLADQLFCDHQVTVRFGEEYGKGDTDYRIVFCKVRKGDEGAFLAGPGGAARQDAAVRACGLYGLLPRPGAGDGGGGDGERGGGTGCKSWSH